MIVSAAGAPGI